MIAVDMSDWIRYLCQKLHLLDTCGFFTIWKLQKQDWKSFSLQARAKDLYNLKQQFVYNLSRLFVYITADS